MNRWYVIALLLPITLYVEAAPAAPEESADALEEGPPVPTEPVTRPWLAPTETARHVELESQIALAWETADEPVWLGGEEDSFLALFRPASRAVKGTFAIAYDRQRSLDSLRVALARQGWNTLAFALPDPPKHQLIERTRPKRLPKPEGAQPGDSPAAESAADPAPDPAPASEPEVATASEGAPIDPQPEGSEAVDVDVLNEQRRQADAARIGQRLAAIAELARNRGGGAPVAWLGVGGAGWWIAGAGDAVQLDALVMIDVPRAVQERNNDRDVLADYSRTALLVQQFPISWHPDGRLGERTELRLLPKAAPDNHRLLRYIRGWWQRRLGSGSS